MKSRDVAQSYASALYELGAEAKALESIEEALGQVVRLTHESGLDQYLLHPLIPNDDKISMLDQIFGDVNPYLLNLLKLLVERNRTRLLNFIYDAFLALRQEKDRVLRVTIFTPFALDKGNLQQEIAARLTQLTNMNVKLNQQVDSTMLGGLRMQIGDKVLDGSIETQLARLKEQILSEE
ncbi:ATP synthase F1 subunit delta [Candidatus Acetothermia bacterium]|nr:ATP synthase F1 subunit delta [Candidatus Acetothermia bacterium]